MEDYIRKLTGFEIGSKMPVDRRFILTKDMMREEPMLMPDVYFAMCSDDGCFYLYNKDNEVLEDTGKFRLFSDTGVKSVEEQLKVLESLLPKDSEGNVLPLVSEQQLLESLATVETKVETFTKEIETELETVNNKIAELVQYVTFEGPQMIEELHERIDDVSEALTGKLESLDAKVDTEIKRALDSEAVIIEQLKDLALADKRINERIDNLDFKFDGVEDVQIDGRSIVTGHIARIPIDGVTIQMNEEGKLKAIVDAIDIDDEKLISQVDLNLNAKNELFAVLFNNKGDVVTKSNKVQLDFTTEEFVREELTSSAIVISDIDILFGE